MVNRPIIWRDFGLDYERWAICQNRAADKPVENHISTVVKAQFISLAKWWNHLKSCLVGIEDGHHCALRSVPGCEKAENQAEFRDSLFLSGQTGSRLQKTITVVIMTVNCLTILP